jgi:hypothetical protein
VQNERKKEFASSAESPGTAELTANQTVRWERSERNRAAAVKRAVRCRKSRKLLLRFKRLPSLVLKWAELWKFPTMRSTSIYGEMTRGCCRCQARRWIRLPPWPGTVVDGWNRVVSWRIAGWMAVYIERLGCQ